MKVRYNDVFGKEWVLVPLQATGDQLLPIRNAVIDGSLSHSNTYRAAVEAAPDREDGLIPLAKEMLARLERQRFSQDARTLPTAVQPSHVQTMLERIITGEVAGEKGHRWLGWCQASFVVCGFCGLDDTMKLTRNYLNPGSAED